MDGIEFDMREVANFAETLAAAPAKVLDQTRAVVQKASLNIKTGMQADASGHRGGPYFPASITYDTRITGTGIEAEIGPDKKRRQGALGNILAFGTAHNGPVFDHTASTRRELPALEKYLGDIAERAL